MNEYLNKANAAAQYAGTLGTALPAANQLNTGLPVKMTALEEAIDQIERMREQVNFIACNLNAFLERAAGTALSAPAQDCQAPQVPQPTGQLPRLGQKLRELSGFINVLSEHASKLNQIA